MGLTLRMAETSPVSTYLSSDHHAGDDTQEDVMWRRMSLGSLQLTKRLCELFYVDELK